MKRVRMYLIQLLLLGGVVLLAPPPLANTEAVAAADVASSAYARKAQLIAMLLSQHHYQHREQAINDQLSAQVLEAYLKNLDVDRYYFLQQDIDAFAVYRHELDDGLRKGDLSAAYRIFERYKQRVSERAEANLALLKKPLDFSRDETLELDRSEAPWPSSKAEQNELWRKRIKHDALLLKLSGQEPDKVSEILTKRYQRAARMAQELTQEEIFAIYINAWTQSFDPHTQYMSPADSENFEIHMSLKLQGIGAMLRNDNDFTEIVELVPGGPAAKSGQLQPKDRIVGVAQGDSGEFVDVVGYRLTDVVKLIRGPKETVVRLQVLPPQPGAMPKVVSLVRNQIELEEQAAKSKTIEVKDGKHTARIGVISLPTFYRDFSAAESGKGDYRSTTRDVRRLLEELLKQGIDGLVVDLRGNGGGSLQEATDLVGLFIRSGPVVQVRRYDGEMEIHRDRDESVIYDGPLTVLVDATSASASEIFAAAIQDYGRGVIVGHKTFGKGTVQSLVELDRFLLPTEPGGQLKLTMAKFYRINGHSTQRRGVEPDIVLPALPLGRDFSESAVETALPWDEIRPVPFRSEGSLAELLPLLRDRHEQRSARSSAFKALKAEFALVAELQNRKVVPLSERARTAERKQAEARQLEAVNLRLAAYGLDPIKDLEGFEPDKQVPDTLLESAAAIAADLSAFHNAPATASRARRAVAH